MNLIELHYLGHAYSVNADYITAINPKPGNEGCEIYTVGDKEPWNTDETYAHIIIQLERNEIESI